MPMQPIDRDVLNSLQHGDERALERVFRERFAPLSEQAGAALDDRAAAPKVVEGAFVRVWAERDSIESPEALEAFLFDAVKSGAARERSRRAAAHRMGSHGGGTASTHAAAATVTLDDAWAHVTRALHAPVDAPHSEQVQNALHDHSRHEAAAHVAALARRPAWQVPTLIAAVAAAAIFAGVRWLDKASADSAVTSAINSPDGRNISTLPSQQGSTTLNDGSKVALGADTKLRIPPDLGAATFRAVKVDGAASFEVAPDPKRPFVVRAGDASITAVGTAFDVTAYPKDAAATVRVRSGEVTVKSLTTGEVRTVAAGGMLAVSAAGAMAAPSAPATAEAFGWTDGRFAIEAKPLREVLPMLVRWYGLDIKVKDESLLARPVTMESKLSSSREAIGALEKSARVKFDYEGKAMVLRDAAAAPGAK